MKKYILLMIGLLILLTCSSLYSADYTRDNLVYSKTNPQFDYTQINFKEPKNDSVLLAVQMIHIPGFAGHTDYTQDANVIAAYLMNDAAGENAADITGNGNTLTISASDTIPRSTTVPSGFSGYSRDFEYADGEYLTQADGGQLDISGSDQSMTVSVWIKIEDDTSDDAIFVSKYQSVTGARQYAFKFDDADDRIEVSLGHPNGTSFQKAQGNTTRAELGTVWHHHSFTYNDSLITIYLDGVVDTNVVDDLDCLNSQNNPCGYVSGIDDGTDPFMVGRYYASNSDNLDGLMDELIIFDRALSADEILEIFTYGIDGTKGAND